MATHRRKVVEVAAKQAEGSITVVHKHKGEQSAKKGDWLVGPDDAERGDIEVIKKDDFERDFEPIEPEPEAEPAHDEPVIADDGNDTTTHQE